MALPRAFRLPWQANMGEPSLVVLTVGAVAVAAALAAVVLRHTYVGVDDANIAMVYARNLVMGHGFAYNVGGERVEGFTSMLFVLVAAGVFAISPLPELTLLGLCVLFAGLSIVLPLTAVRAFVRDGAAQGSRLGPLELIMVAWAVGSPAFILWTTVSLMDVALWACLWSSAVTVVLREIGDSEPRRTRLVLISVLGALLPLARPEGFAAAPLFILAYTLGRRLRTTAWRPFISALAVPTFAWLGATVGITLFRIAYFGFPLPNTYYAKVSPNAWYNLATGARYLAQFLSAQPIVIVVVGAITAGLVLNAKLAVSVLARGSSAAKADQALPVIRVAHFAVSLLALGGLLLPVYAGGDHFAGFRFYQPVWPTLILPIIFLGLDVSATLRARRPDERQRLPWLGALTSLPIIVSLAAPTAAQTEPALPLNEFQIAEDGRRLGVALNRLFPSAPPRVGVKAAGGVQYTYHGPIFDLFGLNDVRMGHSPGERRGRKNHAAFDKTIFWSVRPAVVTPVLCPGPIDTVLGPMDLRTHSDGTLGGIFRDSKFRDHYRMVIVGGVSHRRLFEDDPLFFVPPWFPQARFDGEAYRDARLIAYVARSMVERLVSEGWQVTVMSEPAAEAVGDDAARAEGPCTPPAKAARY
jgi:arabinofuranosyltransferase